MSDYDYNDVEKASLGHIFRSQTKYGTTINTRYRDEVYIEHTVKEDDTLQGIALCHGVTIEDIKRVNQLWSSDVFVLRTIIYIPIARPEESCDSGETTPSFLTRDQLQFTNKLKRSKSPEDTANTTTSVDYLSRFDTSLAEIKSSIDKLQENTNFPEDYSNNITMMNSDQVYISTSNSNSSEPWTNSRRSDDIFQL